MKLVVTTLISLLITSSVIAEERKDREIKLNTAPSFSYFVEPQPKNEGHGYHQKHNSESYYPYQYGGSNNRYPNHFWPFYEDKTTKGTVNIFINER